MSTPNHLESPDDVNRLDVAQTLRRDIATVRSIADDVERLASLRLDLDQNPGMRQRGYFTPDEDDRVRRLLLLYRNYRIALFDVINRSLDFANEMDATRRDTMFLVGYGAAVLLYNWSLSLVNAYHQDPVVRRKLNEPDQSFGIEANLFETIYASLTSTRHLRQLHSAGAWFESRQAEFDALAARDPACAWLLSEVRRQHLQVKHDWGEILADRVQREVRSWRWSARLELREVGYQFTSLVMDWLGSIYLNRVPRIPRYHLARLTRLLQPGDILFVRPEMKSSTLFLPGWWTHAALYYGGAAGLETLGAQDLPHIRAAWPKISGADGSAPNSIIEALAAGVVLNPMRQTLSVDHVTVFRPRLTPDELREGLDSAFGNLGKEYDFEMDFTRSSRLVCTEVVYRSFHGRGPIRFDLVERFGRPTLSADDMVRQILAAHDAGNGAAPLEFVAISQRDMKRNRSRLLVGAEGLSAVRQTLAP